MTAAPHGAWGDLPFRPLLAACLVLLRALVLLLPTELLLHVWEHQLLAVFGRALGRAVWALEGAVGRLSYFVDGGLGLGRG